MKFEDLTIKDITDIIRNRCDDIDSCGYDWIGDRQKEQRIKELCEIVDYLKEMFLEND